MNYGYNPTGEFDTIKAEIVVAIKEVKIDNVTKFIFPSKTLIVVDGYIEREKHHYCGDRMPPGQYDNRYVLSRYLDKDKNEIKDFVWIAREIKEE